MSRTKKTDEMAIVPTEMIEAPIERFGLSNSQAQTLKHSEERIAATAARMQRIERDMKAIKVKIDESEETRQLRKLKAEKKFLSILQRDATSAYNGALEMALADIPGKSLSEKMRNFKNGSN